MEWVKGLPPPQVFKLSAVACLSHLSRLGLPCEDNAESHAQNNREGDKEHDLFPQSIFAAWNDLRTVVTAEPSKAILHLRQLRWGDLNFYPPDTTSLGSSNYIVHFWPWTQLWRTTFNALAVRRCPLSPPHPHTTPQLTDTQGNTSQNLAEEPHHMPCGLHQGWTLSASAQVRRGEFNRKAPIVWAGLL